MAGKRVGKVTHFFDHLSVAVLSLTAEIHVGDTLHFVGHTTDFKQGITSLQIEHKPVDGAKPGEDVAIKVEQPVRPNDEVLQLEGD